MLLKGRPQVVGDRIGEGLELTVGPLELPVGLLQVAVGVLELSIGGLELEPDVLSLDAAVREHPGHAEEHQADRKPAEQHEEGRLLRQPGSKLGSVLK